MVRLAARSTTVRAGLKCTKCGYKKLWIVDKVIHSTDLQGYDVAPLPLARSYKPNATVMIGKFQAFICASSDCGYTEWHAYDLDGLKRLVDDPESGVHFYDGEPSSSGPYR